MKRFANKYISSNKPYHNLQNYSSTTHIHRNVNTAQISQRDSVVLLYEVAKLAQRFNLWLAKPC